MQFAIPQNTFRCTLYDYILMRKPNKEWWTTNMKNTGDPYKGVIIEAVPNFSEGRRMDVIDAIMDAIQTPGVMLLDHSRDADHNRSVMTIAGAPGAVLNGLLRAVAVAAQRIDLRQHTGVHPRIGATDVVPLVPIQGITLAACAELAQDLGQRIGDELALPVYLYEAAATRPERRNLADVRRGGYERLIMEINHPERKPDFGPIYVGPAGAVIVGARDFLIAFNLFLDTDRIEIAEMISRKIRASSGGFPGVKAIGVLVRGQAQVSVNLVDFRRTSLLTVVRAVVRAAAERGVAVTHSELIGLLPEDALLDVAAESLLLPRLENRQIVEHAIALAVKRTLHQGRDA